MAPLSDQALINLYLTTNNNHYFAQLYARHRNKVYLACLSFCEDPNEADDFTQEIFIRLTHKLSGFKGNSKFTTWLQVITNHYCIDQIRERQQRQKLYQRYVEEMDNIDPWQADTDELTFQRMEQVIQQLPSREHDLLWIKYADGVTLKGIAEQQDLTLSAVKMRIKRAMHRARSLYGTIDHSVN